MSTYYKFHCETCNESGGFMSRQAWGCGNFDIVDTFKFVMAHIYCDPNGVHLCSEHSKEYSAPDTPQEKTQDIFPSSGDWGFIATRLGQDWDSIKEQWNNKNKK